MSRDRPAMTLARGAGPQAPHPDRHTRTAAGRQRPSRQRAGSRRSRGSAARSATELSRLERIIADAGYQGRKMENAVGPHGREPKAGFAPSNGRWIARQPGCGSSQSSTSRRKRFGFPCCRGTPTPRVAGGLLSCLLACVPDRNGIGGNRTIARHRTGYRCARGICLFRSQRLVTREAVSRRLCLVPVAGPDI